MPFQKGHAKIGGKKSGTKNWLTRTVSEVCESMGLNPFEGMAIIALNKLPCGVCRGKGKTAYKLPNGDLGMRTCESCYGTLFEACSPELRGKMNAELASYIHPKKKAVEVSNPDGTLKPSWEVVILEDKNGKSRAGAA